MCTPWGWAVTMDFWLLGFGERRSGARGAKQAIFLDHHGGLKPPLGSPASYAPARRSLLIHASYTPASCDTHLVNACIC